MAKQEPQGGFGRKPEAEAEESSVIVPVPAQQPKRSLFDGLVVDTEISATELTAATTNREAPSQCMVNTIESFFHAYKVMRALYTKNKPGLNPADISRLAWEEIAKMFYMNTNNTSRFRVTTGFELLPPIKGKEVRNINLRLDIEHFFAQVKLMASHVKMSIPDFLKELFDITIHDCEDDEAFKKELAGMLTVTSNTFTQRFTETGKDTNVFRGNSSNNFRWLVEFDITTGKAKVLNENLSGTPSADELNFEFGAPL